jgi:hypothetical protein
VLRWQAVVNEDPNEKLIRNLKTEIEELRKALQMSGGQCMEVPLCWPTVMCL